MGSIDPEYNPGTTPEPEDPVRLPEAVVSELKNTMFTTANVKDAAFIPVVIDPSPASPKFGYDLDGNILAEEDVRDAAYSFKLRAIMLSDEPSGYAIYNMSAIGRAANIPFMVIFTDEDMEAVHVMFPTRKEIETGDIPGLNPG